MRKLEKFDLMTIMKAALKCKSLKELKSIEDQYLLYFALAEDVSDQFNKIEKLIRNRRYEILAILKEKEGRNKVKDEDPLKFIENELIEMCREQKLLVQQIAITPKTYIKKTKSVFNKEDKKTWCILLEEDAIRSREALINKKMELFKEQYCKSEDNVQDQVNQIDNQIAILDYVIDKYDLLRAILNWNNRKNRVKSRIFKILKERDNLYRAGENLNQLWKKITDDEQDMCQICLKTDAEAYFL